MEKTRLNWGVLGCSNIADAAVIPAIKAAGNANLQALSTRNNIERLQEFSQRHEPVMAYDGYDKLLEDDSIDAVYIPLPNTFHKEWVIKAAQHGKHVLCEKPIGCTPEEVSEMFEACRKNKVVLMEAFAYRHSPVIKKVKELAYSGIIGKIKLIECYFTYSMEDRRNVRYVKELGGGATYDVGCYNLNFIRYITNSEPVAIWSTGEIDAQSGVDKNVISVLEFENGIKGISHAAFNCGFRNEYRIIGSEGIIEATDGFNAVGALNITIKKGDDFFIRGVDYRTHTIECPDNYMLEIEQFGRCVMEGEEPLITFNDSYNNALAVKKILDDVFAK